MPAVDARTELLPRLPTIDPTWRERPLVSITGALSGFEGEGFPVRPAFAGVDPALLDPFVHMDQMGSVENWPGVRPLPVRPPRHDPCRRHSILSSLIGPPRNQAIRSSKLRCIGRRPDHICRTGHGGMGLTTVPRGNS